MCCIAASMASSTLSEDHLVQAFLPTRLGGLGLRHPTQFAPIAAASATLSSAKALHARMRRAGPNPEGAVAVELLELCRVELRSQGIALDSVGRPHIIHSVGPGVPEIYSSAAILHSFAPPIQGSWAAEVQLLRDEATFQQLFARTRQTSRVAAARLLSAGGPTAGAWLHGAPDSDTSMCTQDFRVWLRARLGIPQSCGSLVCRHVTATSGKVCGIALDQDASHAVGCIVGGAITNTSAAICRCIAAAHRQAGLQTAMEVVVPAWQRPAKRPDAPAEDGRVDIEMWGAQAEATTFIDVTIRSAVADRYLRAGSSERPGVAAEVAIAEKLRRYPAVAEATLTPLAWEAHGRAAPATETYLEGLAARAASRDRDLAVPSPQWVMVWRRRISSILARGLSRPIVSALASECGTNAQPLREVRACRMRLRVTGMDVYTRWLVVHRGTCPAAAAAPCMCMSCMTCMEYMV